MRRRTSGRIRSIRAARGTRRAPRRRGAPGPSLPARAQSSLRRYRQSSLVAVALTGLLLLTVAPEDQGAAQGAGALADSLVQGSDTLSAVPQVPLPAPDSTAKAAAEEATGALQGLWYGFLGNLPKYLIALGILLLAWVLVRVLRAVLRLALARWERADAAAALAGVVIWLLAAGVALSVLLGDIRALAGSLGLVGLALSWALQTPIESFTGWLLNSFKGYYRVGDRISVGEVFGDVYRIDFLNTTVWEIGGRDHPPGWVQAEQPTGRLITFPNNEVLSGTVINYTRDFPYVWDELTVSVANESDLPYTMAVLEGVASALLGGHMREPAQRYCALLQREGLDAAVAEAPEVFAALTDWGTNLTIRYLVGAREKRGWKSQLVVRVTTELNREEHTGRVLPVYPRQQIQFVQADGSAADVQWTDKGERSVGQPDGRAPGVNRGSRPGQDPQD